MRPASEAGRNKFYVKEGKNPITDSFLVLLSNIIIAETSYLLPISNQTIETLSLKTEEDCQISIELKTNGNNQITYLTEETYDEVQLNDEIKARIAAFEASERDLVRKAVL